MDNLEKAAAYLQAQKVNAFVDHNKVWVDIDDVTLSIHPDEVEHFSACYERLI